MFADLLPPVVNNAAETKGRKDVIDFNEPPSSEYHGGLGLPILNGKCCYCSVDSSVSYLNYRLIFISFLKLRRTNFD